MKKIDVKKMTIAEKVEFIKNNDKGRYNALRNHDERIVTRRDFMAHGLLGASSFMFGSMIPFSNAFAQSCNIVSGPAGVDQNQISFISIPVIGGPTFTKAFLPINPDGSLLTPSAYVRHGYSGGFSADEVSRDHGVPMTKNSEIYKAILEKLGAEKMSNIRALLIANYTENDGGGTAKYSAGVISKINASRDQGKFAELVGTATPVNKISRTAGRTEIIGQPGPLINISTSSDADNLVKPGIIGSYFDKDSDLFTKFINSLTKGGHKFVKSSRFKKTFKDKLDCNLKKAQAALMSPLDPNPSSGPESGGNVADIISNFSEGGNVSQLATLGWLTSQGFASAGVHPLGGGDYHRQPRAFINRVDRSIGNAVGDIFKLHDALGKPCVIELCANGAASSARPSPDETGFNLADSDDSSITSTILIGYFPGKKPLLSGKAALIGKYQSNGIVDKSHIIASSKETSGMLSTIAVTANFLALTGQQDLLKDIIEAHGLENVLNAQDIVRWSKIT